MKIYVDRIPEDGLELETTYAPSLLEIGRPDLHVAGPLRLHGRATREAKELFVSAEIDYHLTLSCARCLADIDTRASKSLFLHYDTTRQQVVNITDDVRQEIVLEYPLTALCRPDCLGLCPTCGVNWNDETCAHRRAGGSASVA